MTGLFVLILIFVVLWNSGNTRSERNPYLPVYGTLLIVGFILLVVAVVIGVVQSTL